MPPATGLRLRWQIYNLIRALAAQGKAIIFVSSEYEELLLLSHRIAIMANGHFVEEFDPVGSEINDLMSRLLAANDTLKAQTSRNMGI
jgi:ABC-type sugar transport system ATPase subunit